MHVCSTFGALFAYRRCDNYIKYNVETGSELFVNNTENAISEEVSVLGEGIVFAMLAYSH